MSHLVKSGSAMGPLFSLFVLFLKTSCICSWLTGKCLFYVDVEEFPVATTEKTSQVTYVTMVPRVGNETLRPLGVATGNAFSVTRV